MILPVGMSGSAAGSSGYSIANSLRLRASASAYASRTPASAGNRKTWTWAGWVKRGQLGSALESALFTAGNQPSNTYDTLQFLADFLRFAVITGGVQRILVTTPAVFRDPSAHYHVVLSVDTTQATNSNGVRLWVNGILQQLTFTAYTQNQDCLINSASAHRHGVLDGYGAYLDGYLSHVHFIDGQALDPSYFGQFDANGVWTPKAYSGTYGTNGFKLDFSNGSSLTTLGYDSSGNGNNWTLTNVSLTAGATYDWMVDTPTQNYCTLNPLAALVPASSYLSSANTSIYFANTSAWISVGSTIAVSQGKWYWEVTTSNIASPSDAMIGVANVSEISTYITTNYYVGQGANAYGYYSANGNKYNGGGAAAYGAAYGNVVIGVALDMDTGTLTFYVNNVSQGAAFVGITGTITPVVSSKSGISTVNFGQRPFQYSPPSGFGPLNTSRMPAAPIPNGRKHFDVALWLGDNASPRTITGIGFPPGLVWPKARSVAYSHSVFDEVRGAGKRLITNATNAENTNDASGYVSAFTADGFTMTAGSTDIANVNESTRTYAAWLWKAGGAAVTNNAGSISSQVSANVAAGFSIVTYTGTGANATVGHGLGAPAEMVIVKNRNPAGAFAWGVWHSALLGSEYLILNGTAAKATLATLWNSTVPTSSVFSLGSDQTANENTKGHVALCARSIAGYSKIGSFIGNGLADGPFIFTGGAGGYLMIKRTDAAGSWVTLDAARLPANPENYALYANLSDAETLLSAGGIDVTANGFKLRSTDANINASGGTYIYAWFARNPFGGSNVAPATAR